MSKVIAICNQKGGVGKTTTSSNLGVTTITTDKDGHAWADDLYIGNYILREVDAPEGYIFVDDEKFSITPIEQEKQFTFLTWDLTDVRQKLNLDILKIEQGSNAPLEGAAFSLYAAEDITFGNPATGDDGFIGAITNLFAGDTFNVIHKDDFVASAKSGKDGIAHFTDLPQGKYYVRETQAPKDFKINEDWKPEVTPAYSGHDKETLFWSETCENEVFGNVEIIKAGEHFKGTKAHLKGPVSFLFGKSPLAGVVFEIKDANGNVIETLTTDIDGYAKSSDLPIGKYTLHEKAAPKGYLPVKDKSFEVKPRNGNQAENFFKFDLEDVRRKLDIEILKTDAADGKALTGAAFELVANEDIEIVPATDTDKAVIIKKGTTIMTAKVDEKGRAIFADLPAGEYIVREIKAPDGYELNKDFAPVIKAKYDKADTEHIVFSETCTDKKLPPPPVSTNQPKTGDDFNSLILIVLALSALGITGVLISRRRMDKMKPKI